MITPAPPLNSNQYFIFYIFSSSFFFHVWHILADAAVWTEWMVRSEVADSSILVEQHLSSRAVNIRIAQPCAKWHVGKSRPSGAGANLSQRVQNRALRSRWSSTCDRAANSLVTLPLSHVLCRRRRRRASGSNSSRTS